MDRTELKTLKAQVDLVEVMRNRGLELKKNGQGWFARCPWHADKEASLSVNSEAQLYNCFGCEEAGDVLTFLQRWDELAFPEAVKQLSALVGQVPPPPVRANGSAKEPSADRLAGGLTRPEILSRVAELYHRCFLECSEAQQALVSRGLESRELWKGFQVGYADGSLLGKLPDEGHIREALTQLGVLNERGREHFLGCLMVPLCDPDLGVVGLYGRKLDPEAKVRHLFLPGPRLGVLNWQALKASSRVVVTEGVWDALSVWSSGIREVTCLHGTQGLPGDLQALLERYSTREVVLCLDGDRAGVDATSRLAVPLTERGLRVFSVRLPGGHDPNQVLVESGPESLRKALGAFDPVLLPEGREPVVGELRKETTGDGFYLRFGELCYRVTPRPPFAGRLRVTIRARLGDKFYLDTVDLYVQRARSTAAKQLAQRLGRPRPEAERHLLIILDEAEDWVAELKQAREEDQAAKKRREPPPMTDQEEDEAMEFLCHPHLVDRIKEDMATMGYVGEEKGKLLALLIGISRKLEKPMSGIVRSQSGAGKSAMTEMVETLTPPEDVVYLSRLSAHAIGYMEDDAVQHKLVMVEERVGGEAADYSIRALQSRHEYTQAVPVKDPITGQIKTRQHTVKGPIAYLETTTNARLNYENATRCFEINLDESEEQTRRIHACQREARSLDRKDLKQKREEICHRHHNAQRLLEPMQVFIPYVHHISFPTLWLRTRRDHDRFLCLVEAVAFLHQHQRERGQTEEGLHYILATVADYRLAYWMAEEVLDSTFHELSRGARDLWQAAAEWVGPDPENRRQAMFTRRDLRGHTGMQDHRLRAALAELVDMEYLAVVSGTNGKAYNYRLQVEPGGAEPTPLDSLTTPGELERLVAREKGAQGGSK